MSNTQPTLQAIFESIREAREEQRQFRIYLEGRFDKLTEEIRQLNKTITIMGRDIYDLRTSVSSIDDRLDRLEKNPNAPTVQVK